MPLIPLKEEEKEAIRAYQGGSSQVSALVIVLCRKLKMDVRETMSLLNECVADGRAVLHG